MISSPSRVRARALVVLLGVCLAPAAMAAPGVGLAWNACLGEIGSAQNAVFACDTNVGDHVVHGSFELGATLPRMAGWEAVLDLASSSPVLPAWWQFKNPGTCRISSLNMMLAQLVPSDVCEDWSAGAQQGGIGGYCTNTAICGNPVQPANTARIKLVAAVPADQAPDALGGRDHFAFGLRMNHAKTVGTGACGGCDVPVCIVFNSIRLVSSGGVEHRDLTTPMAPGGNFVAWQGGGSPTTGRGTGCPAATPVVRSNWGSVKSLYR